MALDMNYLIGNTSTYLIFWHYFVPKFFKTSYILLFSWGIKFKFSSHRRFSFLKESQLSSLLSFLNSDKIYILNFKYYFNSATKLNLFPTLPSMSIRCCQPSAKIKRIEKTIMANIGGQLGLVREGKALIWYCCNHESNNRLHEAYKTVV